MGFFFNLPKRIAVEPSNHPLKPKIEIDAE